MSTFLISIIIIIIIIIIPILTIIILLIILSTSIGLQLQGVGHANSLLTTNFDS